MSDPLDEMTAPDRAVYWRNRLSDEQKETTRLSALNAELLKLVEAAYSEGIYSNGYADGWPASKSKAKLAALLDEGEKQQPTREESKRRFIECEEPDDENDAAAAADLADEMFSGKKRKS